MYPEYDPETLEKAAKAYFEEDWKTMLDINLSMLEKHPGNEYLIWHIADTYLKLNNIEKAIEFAEMLKDSEPHRDDIMIRAMHMVQPSPDNINLKNNNTSNNDISQNKPRDY